VASQLPRMSLRRLDCLTVCGYRGLAFPQTTFSGLYPLRLNSRNCVLTTSSNRNNIIRRESCAQVGGVRECGRRPDERHCSMSIRLRTKRRSGVLAEGGVDFLPDPKANNSSQPLARRQGDTLINQPLHPILSFPSVLYQHLRRPVLSCQHPHTSLA